MYGGLERGRWEPYHSGVLDSVGGRKRWEGKGRGGKEREGSYCFHSSRNLFKN